MSPTYWIYPAVEIVQMPLHAVFLPIPFHRDFLLYHDIFFFYFLFLYQTSPTDLGIGTKLGPDPPAHQLANTDETNCFSQPVENVP